MSYKYEIFLSYKWGGERKEWVDKIFMPILNDALHEEVGNRIEVFKDTDNIVYGAALPESLKDALAHSKCMISIITLPYFFDSVWCPTEFSAMLFREDALELRKDKNHTGLIFPIIFVDGNAKSVTEKSPVYKYSKLGNLISSILPLELDIDKYNNINQAFIESTEYNELKSIIRRWVKRSIIPRLDNCPEWDSDWYSEEYLVKPFDTFQINFNEKFKEMSTNPRLG
jgi:TIR domain